MLIYKSSELTKAYILAMTGVVIFGATLPATRLALVDFSPWFITFSRALIASVLAIIWLKVWGKTIAHPRNLEAFFAGLFVVFGFPGFMSLGLQSVSASSGGVVLGLLPLLTAIFAALYAGERQSRIFWSLCVLGAAIVVVFVLFTSELQSDGSYIGYFWLLASGMSAAFGYVIFGKISREIAGSEVICRALMLNFPIIVIGTIGLWENGYLNSTPIGMASLAYLGIFSMLLGFFAWNKALAIGGIGKIGQVQLLQIFVTLVVSAILLGEVIDLNTIIAATAVTIIVSASKYY